jgi:hypothetical protein
MMWSLPQEVGNMEHGKNVIEASPIRLDENSSASPTYVLRREILENSTRAAATTPTLVVVPPALERTSDGHGEIAP